MASGYDVIVGYYASTAYVIAVLLNRYLIRILIDFRIFTANYPSVGNDWVGLAYGFGYNSIM